MEKSNENVQQISNVHGCEFDVSIITWYKSTEVIPYQCIVLARRSSSESTSFDSALSSVSIRSILLAI